MAEVGIAIVTYNSEAEIGPCLDAAMRFEADIVVVDNASTDRTVAEAKRRGVRIIANATNLGFAAAVNQAFAVLRCPYVLLLNPDSVLETGLDALRNACDLPGAAGAGGCLLDPAGSPQTGFMVRQLPTPGVLVLESLLLNRLWPNNPINRRYRGIGLDYSLRLEVEQPAGAFLMVRRAVWEELGGFDEGFFPLWFEDVDFCRRVKDRGYLLYYEPAAIAKHAGAHSISKLAVEKRRLYWYRSLLRYSARHFGFVARRVVCLAVIVGSVVRVIADMAVHRSLQPMAGYGSVLRPAGRNFLFGWGDGMVASGPRK